MLISFGFGVSYGINIGSSVSVIGGGYLPS